MRGEMEPTERSEQGQDDRQMGWENKASERKWSGGVATLRCEEMRGIKIRPGKMWMFGAVEYGSDLIVSVEACTVQHCVSCIYLFFFTHMEQHMVTANWKEVIQLGAFGWLIVPVTCIYPRAGMMLWRSHSWNCSSHLDRGFNWVHPTTLQMYPLLFHNVLSPAWPENW